MANLVGVIAAVAMCAWYHKRMLERKRKSRGYHLASGTIATDRDVELGGLDSRETNSQTSRVGNIEQELDNWDENDEDEWNETEDLEPQNNHEGKQEPTIVHPGNPSKEIKQRKE